MPKKRCQGAFSDLPRGEGNIVCEDVQINQLHVLLWDALNPDRAVTLEHAPLWHVTHAVCVFASLLIVDNETGDLWY